MPTKKRKRGSRYLFWFIFFVVLLIGIGYAYYLNRFRWCEKKPRYAAFGISLPGSFLIHGIDVARYQGLIDWKAVSTMNIRSVQLQFSFIKATEGSNYVDPYFERNWRASGKTRMVRGAYHYFKPQVDGRKQADHFIRQVVLSPGDLPPVLDVEVLEGASPRELVNQVRRWVDRIEKHYNVKPIIYSGADFYNKYLSADFSDYPLWVAHYYEPCEPRVRGQWQFWQHNDRGRVDGIGVDVDFNVFNGSREAFDSLLIPKTIP